MHLCLGLVWMCLLSPEDSDEAGGLVLCFGLLIAIGAVQVLHLVGEPKGAHPRLGDAAAAVLPGAADGKPHAAVSQPAAVTPVVVTETPGGVKMADQRQLAALALARESGLAEGEGARDVGDGA